MRQLFIKILFFIISLSSLILILDLFTSYNINNNNFYKLDSSVRILIMGNSHSQYALNDSIIRYSLNLSSSAESYFYTYYKLKKIVNANPQIKMLILEYSDYVFSDIMEKWTYGEEFMGYNFPHYSHIIPFKEKLNLFSKNPKPFLITWKDALLQKSSLFFLKKKNKLYIKLQWGHYNPVNISRIEELKQKEKNSGPILKSLSQNLTSYASYLDSINRFCNSNNIKLILFRSPLLGFNAYHINFEKALLHLYKNKYATVQLWDYSKYKLDNLHFYDFEHLNYFGAEILSKEVNNKIESLNQTQ
jgi:hypothetical protein